MRTVHSKEVKILCTDNDKELSAEVDYFKENVHFDAYIANNRIRMKWNGKVYVGNSAGLEFTSVGPEIHQVTEGRRK